MEYIVEIKGKIVANNLEEAKEKAKNLIRNDEYFEDNLRIVGDEYKLFTLRGYVIISHYREKVLTALESAGINGMMPTEIAYECGIRRNHISKTLKELVNKELITCINPEAKKGRIYRLTGLGETISGMI